jgi:hypothetical protein
MPYKVTIKTGLTNVVIGGQGPFQAGDVVMLTDEQFFTIRPTAFASLFEGGTVTGISSTATTSPYA